METILFKYSEFFDNDGGFERLKKDFIKLGDDLIKESLRIKKAINESFKLEDEEAIDEQEKQVEELIKTFKKFSDARDTITKVEKEFQKTQKKGTKTNENRIDSLVELDKSLNKFRIDLKKANQSEKDNIKTGDDLNKIRVNAQINIKKTQTEIRKLQKEVIEQNQLSTKEKKLLKARITLQKDEIKNVDDIRERLSALRLVRNQVNITTEEGVEKVRQLNSEIDDLTEMLSDNSDKFIQNKINIGNYEESITNALKGQTAFSTGIGVLDNGLQNLLGIFIVTTKELEDLENATDGNTTAVKRFRIAFGKLNKTLKVSIIGVIIVGIAALASAFGNTRAGAIRLEKVMMTLSTTFTIFGQTAKILFTSIPVLIKSFINDLNPLNRGINTSGIVIKKIFNDISEAAKEGTDAVILGLENIEKAFQIEDRIRRLSQEIERLNGLLSISQSIADDSTKSLNSQLIANERSLMLTEEIGKKQIEINKAELEAINERLKQNILANTVEADNIDLSLTGIEFAKATLDLAQRRGIELEISNDLIEEQQSALLEVQKAENELQLTREENGKKRREIERDIFEQNLDLLIDLIDTEKNLSEKLVNDINVNFRRRINEFNRFLVAFRVNAQKELDEFTKVAQTTGLDLDFQVEFDSQGNLKIFVNDTELAINNIIDLNKQLQDLGINEITINRFREFIIESRNGIRDFRDLNIELGKIAITVDELFSNIATDRLEIEGLDELFAKIQKLSAIDQSRLSKKERQQLLKDLKDLEEQKNQIIKFAEEKRRDNRLQAINEELKIVEEGSVRELELLREKSGLEKQIRESAIQDTIKNVKDANDLVTEQFEKFAKELNRITGLVLDKLLEVNNQRAKESEERVNKQEEQVSKQEERAKQGLTNTLAFEQKELAKRESDRIKQQKRIERLEKIKALFSTYSSFASDPNTTPGTALAKTLRDFAILEAIVASFGEGGIVEDVIKDKVPTNGKGIIRGQSHRGRNGGIPVLVEGQEGIFSKKEMANLGKSNFYNIKDMASTGPLSHNFFSGQKDSFIKAIPVASGNNDKLLNEMRDVKQAIQRKPVTELHVPEVVDGILKFVETVHTKNSKKRNHYVITKNRL